MYQWFSGHIGRVQYEERLIPEQTTHDNQNESKWGVNILKTFILQHQDSFIPIYF